MYLMEVQYRLLKRRFYHQIWGLNPQTEGSVIRLRLPDLTEERRDELVKYVKKLTEEGKVSLRNIRRDALDELKKSDDLSEDDKKRESD